jgi:hypothetical protein
MEKRTLQNRIVLPGLSPADGPDTASEAALGQHKHKPTTAGQGSHDTEPNQSNGPSVSTVACFDEGAPKARGPAVVGIDKVHAVKILGRRTRLQGPVRPAVVGFDDNPA